jgi:hypothetical protein
VIVAALLFCLVHFEVNGSPAHSVKPSACVQLLTFLADIPRIDLAFGLSFLQLLYHTLQILRTASSLADDITPRPTLYHILF